MPVIAGIVKSPVAEQRTAVSALAGVVEDDIHNDGNACAVKLADHGLELCYRV